MGDGAACVTPRETAKLLHGSKPNVCITFWNMNGMGQDWDGHSSGKLAHLQSTGSYDAVLLAETHLTRIPEGPEWSASAPVQTGDKSGGAL